MARVLPDKTLYGVLTKHLWIIKIKITPYIDNVRDTEDVIMHKNNGDILYIIYQN